MNLKFLRNTFVAGVFVAAGTILADVEKEVVKQLVKMGRAEHTDEPATLPAEEPAQTSSQVPAQQQVEEAKTVGDLAQVLNLNIGQTLGLLAEKYQLPLKKSADEIAAAIYEQAIAENLPSQTQGENA